jgi:hypothetical protein
VKTLAMSVTADVLGRSTPGVLVEQHRCGGRCVRSPDQRASVGASAGSVYVGAIG